MMVVLEENGTHRPELARRACPYLVTLLSHQDPNRRGDATFLLCSIGDAKVLEGLEPMAEDGSPEVAEAAREAIKRIRGDLISGQPQGAARSSYPGEGEGW